MTCEPSVHNVEMLSSTDLAAGRDRSCNFNCAYAGTDTSGDCVHITNRKRAAYFLRGYWQHNPHTLTELSEAIYADPVTWYAPYHFHWGMSVRNCLRRHGYDEQALGVFNLDDIYVSIIEDAVSLNTEDAA